MNAYQIGRYAAKQAAEDAVSLDRGEASSAVSDLGKSDIKAILDAMNQESNYLSRESVARAPDLGFFDYMGGAGKGAVGGAAAGAAAGAGVSGGIHGIIKLIQKLKGRYPQGLRDKSVIAGSTAGGGVLGTLLGIIYGLYSTRARENAGRDKAKAELLTRTPGRLGMRMMRTTELPTQMSIASEMETLGGREKDRIARAIKELALKGKGG